jgi:uncharacterized protein involved in exopolysaccharide biosynthesis
MEIHTEETSHGDGVSASAAPSPSRSERTVWDALGILYRRRRLIGAVTAVVAVASVVIALLMPRYYMGEARVLEPESGALSLLGGLAGSVGGGLSGLLGGGGEYSRYLTILTSRSMMEEVVESFDLVRDYDLQDSEAPVYEAVMELSDNVEFAIDDQYLFLAVRAYDPNPEQAAAMANFMVEALNAEYARLTSANARQTRLFVEQRLERAEADLDSVRAELQAFQEENGLVELESQAQAFMSSMAETKGRVAEAEVRYQTLLQQYGPDNAQVRAAREMLRAIRGQVSGAFGGRDELLPVSMRDLPSLTRRYAELMQSQLVQAQIIETIYPFYEQAVFQEQNEVTAVQVVDEAEPPVLAARPSRRMIVVAATLSAFLLVVVYVLAHAWWRRHYRTFARRLQQAARNHPESA